MRLKKMNTLNIVQGLLIIILLISNYFSYNYHSNFAAFVDSIAMKCSYYLGVILNNVYAWYIWLITQEYDFSFNSREMAYIIFIVGILIGMIIMKSTRESFFSIIKCLFNKHFIRVYFEILAYTFVMVFALYKVGFWSFTLTKDMLLWVLFSALYLSYKTADNKDNNHFLRDIIKDAISVSVIIEFLLNTYTLPIIWELVLLVVIVLVGIMLAFIEVCPEKDVNGQVHKLFSYINIYIGVNIFIYVILKAIGDLRNLMTFTTLKEILLPIILTIGFIPYLFMLMMRIAYEHIIISLPINKLTKKNLSIYFKIRMYIYCNFNRNKVQELWNTRRHNISNIRTKEDIDNIFL